MTLTRIASLPCQGSIVYGEGFILSPETPQTMLVGLMPQPLRFASVPQWRRT